MDALNFIVYQLLTNQVIFLGLIALVGLLLQKKKLPQTIDGVVKTVIGFLVVSSGAGIVNSSLSKVVTALNGSLGVAGVLPLNEAAGALVLSMESVGRNAVLIFLFAFLLHLLLVRLIPAKDFKNVYLTAHLALFHACFMAVTLPAVLGVDNAALVIGLGSVLNALYFTLSPAITRKLARAWTGDVITLGFNDQVGSLVATGVGRLVGSTEPAQDADKLKLPKWAIMFRDNTVVLFFLMPIIFIGMGVAVGQDGIQALAGKGPDATNWFIWLVIQAWTFTAGIVILLQGVRMFVGSIVPAFKGISDRFLPGSIPALDAPTFFPYSPMGGMFGFLGSSVGAILVCLLTIALHSPIIVFPSPIIMYFDGNVMGVFGNKAGGWKGALAAGFAGGLITSAAVILFYPLTGAVFGQGVTWSNIDYAIVWMPVMYVIKFISALFI
ncbi:PTS system transporter subunit IIC [Coriobacterium glomerans PW2]|uniref:Ascorbate-specific PTS system EIIC component n=1 Tax=Coriobacterium glomerans (strain ATCC 49209 / DSM 20642 / JCM 10262 / PW2) TaxID=700015 RepID=F2NAT8_CORGP|nr:PTS transporter subunit IIC [Coriobacterium glomerans]AEB07616.1 PTS system transporter subunit IIC [Coriobacterium glomerans PW2]